jgi:Endodeoxyribonuclease RusA
MHSFIFKQQPKSFNSWKGSTLARKLKYKADIEASFKRYNPSHVTLADDLYGVLYYFFKEDTKSDADNLSKPFWDCLKGILFMDDKQVKLRTAGVFDLSKTNFKDLNFLRLSEDVTAELFEAFKNNNHFVYLECGPLESSMFKFNLEANEY